MNTKPKQGYRTTAQLLAKAAQDSDDASAFANGTSWGDTDWVIFVVKGEAARDVHGMLEQCGYITPGKRVVDKSAPALCSDCPPQMAGDKMRCLPCPRRRLRI